MFEAGVQNQEKKIQKLNLNMGSIEIVATEQIYHFLDLLSMIMTDL